MSFLPSLVSITCIKDCSLDVVMPFGSDENSKVIDFKKGQCFTECVYTFDRERTSLSISFKDGSYLFGIKPNVFFKEVSERYVTISEILEDIKL